MGRIILTGAANWGKTGWAVEMLTHVTFTSSEYPPYGESQEVNPGRYGKRLAEFLAQGLAAKGFETSKPNAEDWGWAVAIKNDGFKLWIGCGNMDEADDSFLCFIEPHQPVVRRFPFLRKIDTSLRIKALQRAMDSVLSANASIKDKRWWSYEEFQAGEHRPGGD